MRTTAFVVQGDKDVNIATKAHSLAMLMSAAWVAALLSASILDGATPLEKAPPSDGIGKIETVPSFEQLRTEVPPFVPVSVESADDRCAPELAARSIWGGEGLGTRPAACPRVRSRLEVSPEQRASPTAVPSQGRQDGVRIAAVPWTD